MMICQYFTGCSVRSPIVLCHVRRRFARFNLCAHLLDLRGLLFHGCSERLNFLLLLCNSRLEVFPLL